MQWVPVESSVLANVAYDLSLQQLYLEFHSGLLFRCACRDIRAITRCRIEGSLFSEPHFGALFLQAHTRSLSPDELIGDIAPLLQFFRSLLSEARLSIGSVILGRLPTSAPTATWTCW